MPSNQQESLARPLRHSGEVWSSRLVAGQRDLAHQLATVLCPQTSAAGIGQAGDWLLAADGTAVMYPWSFKATDMITQGPAEWGYDPVTLSPLAGSTRPVDLSANRAYLTSDGRIVETAAGGPLPSDSHALSEQTVWFLPRPPDFHPVLLVSESETLEEGTGFICAGAWIMFYTNPEALWPGHLIVSFGVRVARSWKSGMLKADSLYTSGREIALYRRNTQCLRQFERALCEVAGLPILETEGQVVRIESAGNQVAHWLADGRCFRLPVSTPYTVGSSVPAGVGHILQLRHQSLQGGDWWRGRPWGAAGLPIWVFRPHFFSFSVRDEQVAAVSREEGGKLRAKLEFGQNSRAESLYWEWQAMAERQQGTETMARGILGFTAAGQTKQVNALETYVTVCGPWLAVVETSLDVVDPSAFRRVTDFIVRERPAGLRVFTAGTDESFTVPEAQRIYLNTGEMALLDGDPAGAPAIPLGY